jgi:hypothetical protein
LGIRVRLGGETWYLGQEGNFAGGLPGLRCGQAFLDLKSKSDSVLGKPLGRDRKEVTPGLIRRDGHGVHHLHLGLITEGLCALQALAVKSENRQADAVPVQREHRA